MEFLIGFMTGLSMRLGKVSPVGVGFPYVIENAVQGVVCGRVADRMDSTTGANGLENFVVRIVNTATGRV